MSNEGTKKQLRDAIERDIRNSKNPDPRERLKRARKDRAKKIAKQYGF